MEEKKEQNEKDVEKNENVQTGERGKKSENYYNITLGIIIAIGIVAIIAIAYLNFFGPRKLEIILMGPNTGAVEDSIIVSNGRIILQGTGFEALKMAGDRLSLIAMGIGNAEGLDIKTAENGNLALEYGGIVYEFTTDINRTLDFPVQSEWTIKKMLDEAELIDIKFDGSSAEDNSYFTVVAFNMVSKIKVFYSSMGKKIAFTSGVLGK